MHDSETQLHKKNQCMLCRTEIETQTDRQWQTHAQKRERERERERVTGLVLGPSAALTKTALAADSATPQPIARNPAASARKRNQKALRPTPLPPPPKAGPSQQGTAGAARSIGRRALIQIGG